MLFMGSVVSFILHFLEGGWRVTAAGELAFRRIYPLINFRCAGSGLGLGCAGRA